MKITFTLHRNGQWYENTRISLCGEGIGRMFRHGRFSSPAYTYWPSTITLTITTKNPKQRGFVKFLYRKTYVWRRGDSQYVSINTRLEILPRVGLSDNQSFWAKLTIPEIV